MLHVNCLAYGTCVSGLFSPAKNGGEEHRRPSSVHKLPRVSTRLLLKRRNIGTNIKINCTFVNLGLLLLFLCNLGSIHGRFFTVLRHVVYSVSFSYRTRRSKAGDCVQSRLTNLSFTDERRTDSPLKRQFFNLFSSP